MGPRVSRLLARTFSFFHQMNLPPASETISVWSRLLPRMRPCFHKINLPRPLTHFLCGGGKQVSDELPPLALTVLVVPSFLDRGLGTPERNPAWACRQSNTGTHQVSDSDSRCRCRLTCSLSHTHTHKHTHTLSLSLSHKLFLSLTHTHWASRCQTSCPPPRRRVRLRPALVRPKGVGSTARP